YDSTPDQGQAGWFVVGGTSLATPMWAARTAIAGYQITPSSIYSSSTFPFRDITTGNNGAPAGFGYDLATGRGSWADDAEAAAPAAPTGVSASASGTTVSLSWSPSTNLDTVDSYTVVRSDGKTVATGVLGLKASDTGVPQGTYTYTVEAVNARGPGSPSSPSGSVTVGGTTSPPVASFTSACHSTATCTFSSTSSGSITTYAWSGSVSGSGPSVTKTFTSTGTHTETLKVTGPGGSSTKSGSVTCTRSSRKAPIVCG
ncbi:MAG TPA: PKD domain-containing protein, partial [Acidimicrobiales bacterium]